MPRKKVKSPEEVQFDKLVRYLYKDIRSIKTAREKFTSRIFKEWIENNPDIVSEALVPPASTEKEILLVLQNILIDHNKITLKNLLTLAKEKTNLRTQTQLKSLLPLIKSPSISYPNKMAGASVIIVEKASLSPHEFSFQLRQAYDSAPSKMGNMVEISVLAEIIKENTGWSLDLIYKNIYNAYLEKEVDLQPGKVTSGKALQAEDGSKFVWFQYR
jgi:hypothetical protein